MVVNERLKFRFIESRLRRFCTNDCNCTVLTEITPFGMVFQDFTDLFMAFMVGARGGASRHLSSFGGGGRVFSFRGGVFIRRLTSGADNQVNVLCL